MDQIVDEDNKTSDNILQYYITPISLEEIKLIAKNHGWTHVKRECEKYKTAKIIKEPPYKKFVKKNTNSRWPSYAREIWCKGTEHRILGSYSDYYEKVDDKGKKHHLNSAGSFIPHFDDDL